MLWLFLRKLIESNNFLKFLQSLFCRAKRTAQFYIKLLSLLRPTLRVKNKVIGTNIVIIASDFLPSIHGGIYRPLSWLNHASEHRIAIQLLTNKSLKVNPVGLSLLSDPTLAGQIHYCIENEFQLFFRPARLWLARPEFLLAALSSLETINRKQKISHLVATGPDFTSFVIASIFAIKHQCKVHLDYRDEWTKSPFEFSQATFLARVLEKRCVNLADSISLTTQSQLEHFRASFGRSHDVFLKLNGCDNFLLTSSEARKETDPIRLCHSGSIGGHNSLGDVLTLLKSLRPILQANGREIELKFCGMIADAQKELLLAERELNIMVHGQLTPEQAYNESAAADINLLLIDQRFQRYLPGKLFGYIATGNPILIIGTEFSFEIAKICVDYGVAHFFVNVPQVDQVACANFILNAPRSKTAPEHLVKFRRNLNRKTLAKTFFDIFNVEGH